MYLEGIAGQLRVKYTWQFFTLIYFDLYYFKFFIRGEVLNKNELLFLHYKAKIRLPIQ